MNEIMMSPAEQENEIRADYLATQSNIKAIIEQLLNEYEYLTYLQEQIADIDVYGADDLFGKPTKCDDFYINVSTASSGYDF